MFNDWLKIIAYYQKTRLHFAVDYLQDFHFGKLSEKYNQSLCRRKRESPGAKLIEEENKKPWRCIFLLFQLPDIYQRH